MSTTFDPVDLTRALVQTPSVTPDSGAALDIAEQALTEMGLTCTRLPFSEHGTPDVDNLYARIGSSGPYLAFAGHLDVVPTGPAEAWRHEPFSATEEGGKLYGRGATDMKSGVATFIAALSEFLSENGSNFGGSISLILTGDEEGPSVNGTPKILGWMRENGQQPDHCIVGEPTSRDTTGDQIKIGRRGTISGRLFAIGKQGHVAYQHMAENAITSLAAMITAIKSDPLDEGTDKFEPSNIEFTQISTSNRAGNVIPGEAEAAFNIRYNVSQTPNTLKAALIKRISSVARRDGFRLELDRPSGEPFLTEDATLLDLVNSAIKEATGHTPDQTTGGGTSDARYIKDTCPVVEVGLPGKTMHEVDECVEISEIKTLSTVYKRIMTLYFQG